MQEENFNQNKENETPASAPEEVSAPEAVEDIKEELHDSAESPEIAPTVQQSYVYHWDAAPDGANPTQAKVKQKGYLTFAITMCVAFLIALSALVIVLLFAPDGGELPSYTALYEKCAPFTVSIETSSGSIGSGFFITDGGRLLTNQHVVGNNSTVTVKTYDGNIYLGKVIGYSKTEDIAVVDIILDDSNASTTFTAAKLVDSDHVKTGDPIIAIGCPAKAYMGWTMTVGYVSNAARSISVEGRTVIQFDAPVNPGNSGGPLINANGDVIGIIQSKASETKYVYDVNNKVIGYVEGTYEGLGFAIPANSAKATVNAIIEKYEKNPNAPKPQLGISGFQVLKAVEYFIHNEIRYQVYTNESNQKYIINKSNQMVILTNDIITQGELLVAAEDGIYVSGVFETAGAYGKLQKNDIIIQIDNIPINRSQLQLYNDNSSDFMTIVSDVLNAKNVGDTVAVTVIRNGETITVSITLTQKSE